ncbi:hypothetical protein EV700_3114 [Fluviicoccus keumensis]|uniref:Uncharacterized protein n=1 Tax=Fluviicoccus keumensis TaxID=1435465 RepID=A0A4Q7YJU5_9GAMM|nr:hypothetical protein [Fluviicoccus keumensis]RZU36901.1 hypothetical protein EV700_3114 [Fluviicoccus keumensis]
MPPSDRNADPTAERFITLLMTVFFQGFGWLALLDGGISLKNKRGDVSFVDGYAGLAVAGFSFLISLAVAVLLLKSFNAGPRGYVLAAVLALTPPLLFVLLSR